VGVDLVEPERLAERLDGNPALRTVLFRAGELTYCDSQNEPEQHLAARYCAKEAVKKALGLDAWDPLDIEVVGGGEPVGILLHDDAQRRATELGVQVAISMSHLPGMAVAVAMARFQDQRAT